jgi:uncharacterized protein YunC (DUF1805 family)
VAHVITTGSGSAAVTARQPVSILARIVQGVKSLDDQASAPVVEWCLRL